MIVFIDTIIKNIICFYHYTDVYYPLYTQYFLEFCEQSLQANHTGRIQPMTFSIARADV